jgi:light-regulated signal transduction histidine kinase (bacteriophytochrome)
VSKIHTSSDRLSVLIQDVLNFSSIEFSQNAFVKKDLSTILENVIGDFDLVIEEKQAVVKRDSMPVIDGDSDSDQSALL